VAQNKTLLLCCRHMLEQLLVISFCGLWRAFTFTVTDGIKAMF